MLRRLFRKRDRTASVVKGPRVLGPSAKRSNLRSEGISSDIEHCDGKYVFQINRIVTIGSTERVRILFLRTNLVSIKQWVDPESTKAFILWFGIRDDNKLTTRELRDKRAEALSLTSPNAQTESVRPSVCAEARRLLTIFSRPRPMSRL
jgi:hypothetical protein